MWGESCDWVGQTLLPSVQHRAARYVEGIAPSALHPSRPWSAQKRGLLQVLEVSGDAYPWKWSWVARLIHQPPVSTTVMCLFSAPVLRMMQDLAPTRSIVLPGTRSKYMGVSSMFPTIAFGNRPLFRSFSTFCRNNFILLSIPAGSFCVMFWLSAWSDCVERSCTPIRHWLWTWALAAGSTALPSPLPVGLRGRCRSLVSNNHWTCTL